MCDLRVGNTLPDLGMSSLTLTTSPEQRGVRVALSGELDISSALTFEEELRRIEQAGDPETMVLDLQGLKFLDSTGLRLILSAHVRARRDRRRLRIVLPGNRAVQRIFQLSGASERLDIVEAPA